MWERADSEGKCVHNIHPADSTRFIFQHWIIVVPDVGQSVAPLSFYFHKADRRGGVKYVSLLQYWLPCWAAVPASTTHRNNAGLMLGQRRRRWPNIKPALFLCVVFVRVGWFRCQYNGTTDTDCLAFLQYNRDFPARILHVMADTDYVVGIVCDSGFVDRVLVACLPLSVSHLASQPTSMPASQTASQPASQPARQTDRQTDRQPASQPTKKANQPVSQPARQPANHWVYYLRLVFFTGDILPACDVVNTNHESGAQLPRQHSRQWQRKPHQYSRQWQRKRISTLDGTRDGTQSLHFGFA